MAELKPCPFCGGKAEVEHIVKVQNALLFILDIVMRAYMTPKQEQSKHGTGGQKMALKKIDLMHRTFGKCEGHTCGECSNLIEQPCNKRIYRKCKVYGVTDSGASDWAKRWQGCGLFNKPWEGRTIMWLVRPTRTDKEEAQRIPLDGQISMEV